MRIAIALLFPLFFIAAARAGDNAPCFKCKLHGACPLPDFVELGRCLAAQVRTDEPPGRAISPGPPSAADGSGWITTPCGRIRVSR